eukprot:8937013-Pyramimonas_sp.AAC.1
MHIQLRAQAAMAAHLPGTQPLPKGGLHSRTALRCASNPKIPTKWLAPQNQFSHQRPEPSSQQPGGRRPARRVDDQEVEPRR